MKWQLTDQDNQQYGRFISGKTFEFKEFNRRNNNLIDELNKLGEQGFYNLYFNKLEYWIQRVVNLQEYTIKQQKSYCSAYYPEQEFKDLTDWIIAECIFEQESGLY